jgi:hypothetical protein
VKSEKVSSSMNIFIAFIKAKAEDFKKTKAEAKAKKNILLSLTFSSA